MTIGGTKQPMKIKKNRQVRAIYASVKPPKWVARPRKLTGKAGKMQRSFDFVQANPMESERSLPCHTKKAGSLT
jgi:hypothetical protein